MTRKPHPQSKLKTLPDDDQAALFEYLQSNTLAEGVQWVFSNNGIRTNDSSLSEWRGWYELRRRLSSWSATAEDIKSMLGADGSVDPELAPKLAEAFFMAKAAEQGDAKTFSSMASIVQRHIELKNQQKAHADKMQLEGRKLKRRDRALDQMQQKLEHEERKVAALEAEKRAAVEALTKAGKDGGATEDTIRIVRQALGMSDEAEA